MTVNKMSRFEARNTNVPCYNCKPPKRNAECHANCKEYLAYSAENQKRNEIERARKSLIFNKHFI